MSTREALETLEALAARHKRHSLAPTPAPVLSTPDGLQTAQQAVSRAIAAVGALYETNHYLGIAEALLALNKAENALIDVPR